MASFSINTTKEEQTAVVVAIRETKGETVSMSKLAEMSGVGKNRVRYVITDLLDNGRIRQIATTQFGPHYKRFKYEVC